MWLRPYFSLPSIIVSLFWENPIEFCLKVQQRFGIRLWMASKNETSAPLWSTKEPRNYELPGEIHRSTRGSKDERKAVLYFANNSTP